MCGYGHYAVVIGRDPLNLIFADPLLMTRGFLTKKEFLTRWHDRDRDGLDYDRLGIAIYGKPPRFQSRKARRIR